MKIDVEGTENRVFADGQMFLERFRPEILCEILHGVADAEELASLLRPHGYHFYSVRGHALALRTRIDPDPRFRDWFLSGSEPSRIEALGLPVASP